MALEVKVPSPGESVTEVTIDTWHKNTGDYIERDEPLADIQSDKAMLELYAEESGVVKILIQDGETVEVGTVICTIDTDAAAPAASESKEEAKPSQAEVSDAKPQVQEAVPQSISTYATGVPSPSAERLSSEKNIALSDVNGTGRGGRITKADVVNYTPSSKPSVSSTEGKKSPLPSAASAPTSERNERREKMSQLRRTLASRLVSVKNETAMLTTFNEVDMTAILELRKKYKDKFKEKYGVGLGFMSFFSKACSSALMEFPAVNSFIDGTDLVYHDYVDMGIAVSTERGLVVPVLRNAEMLSFAGIEMHIMDMAQRARANKISIQEMMGGTFTITNGGVFGSLMSTPILNPPQSAILGMHKIEERAVVINGQVEVRKMMYLALSYDHRVIDGKESVSFLVRVKEYLEEPTRLLLSI